MTGSERPIKDIQILKKGFDIIVFARDCLRTLNIDLSALVFDKGDLKVLKYLKENLILLLYLQETV